MPPTLQVLDNEFTHSPGYAIRYSERPEYSENYNREGGEIRRRLQCNWNDIRDFPVAILGDVEPHPNAPALDRHLPHQHPHDSKKLYGVECNLLNGHGAWTKSLDPSGGGGPLQISDLVNNLQGLAEWEVVYRQLPYDVEPNNAAQPNELYRYVSRVPKYSMENYPMPGLGWRWDNAKPVMVQVAQVTVAKESGVKGAAKVLQAGFGILKPLGIDLTRGPRTITVTEVPGTRRLVEDKAATSQNIPEPVVKRRPLIELRYTWHWVPEPIPAVYLSANTGVAGASELVVGRLNNGVFDKGSKFSSAGYPANYCLCGEPQVSEMFHTPSGKPVRDITIPFYFRPDAPWTKLWRQLTGTFESIVPVQKGGDPLYHEADLNSLFVYKP